MKTILVVDDDFAMRRGIGLKLKANGYRVFEAEDSEHAMSLLSETTIHLAIVDLFLPGQDGLELADQIRRSSPSTKIMIVTARDEHMQAKVAQERFGPNFLSKSDLGKLLLERVEEIFEPTL